MSNINARIMLAGLAGLAASSMGAIANVGHQVVMPVRSRRSVSESVFGSFSTGFSVYRKKGPGWTTAHVKRMAKKRRNIIRNKRSHKGA